MLVGRWRFDQPTRTVQQQRTKPGALTITTRPLPWRDATSVEAEARRFIEFVSPGGRHDVVVTVRE